MYVCTTHCLFLHSAKVHSHSLEFKEVAENEENIRNAQSTVVFDVCLFALFFLMFIIQSSSVQFRSVCSNMIFRNDIEWQCSISLIPSFSSIPKLFYYYKKGNQKEQHKRIEFHCGISHIVLETFGGKINQIGCLCMCIF